MKALLGLLILITCSGCATMGRAMQGFNNGFNAGRVNNSYAQSQNCTVNHIGQTSYVRCQ